jgi:hypothetical protein
MLKNENDYCRVCGLQQDQPWGEDGETPSFSICPCCGVEFGYEDSLPEGVRAFRKEWLGAGAPWFRPTSKPENWNLEAQMRNIPTKFR